MNPPITVDLSNTPGLYYALAYWMGCVFYIHFLPKRLHGWKLNTVRIGMLIPMMLLLFVMEFVSVVWFIPNVIMRVGLMLLCIKTCCDVNWHKAGYFCGRAFILAEFSASLEWQLFYYGLTVLGMPLRFDVNLVFLVVSHGAVFGIMYYLENKQREAHVSMQVTGKTVVSTFLIVVAVFAASNLSYAFEKTPFSSQFTAEIYIIRTWVDLAGVIMLYAYQIQLQELNAKLELEHMQQIMRMQYANYRISKDSIDLVERKYHDLKHQINLLRSEISQADRLEYLDALEQEIRSYEAQNKTGNQVLDILLTAKSHTCQNLGIRLTCVADGSTLDFMHSMDLSALFGNALDNAIESVSKIADPEKRLIHLSVARQKQFVRIRVENCYEGELVYSNGKLVTTKQDKLYHGFGLKSMQDTVSKYGGSLTIDAREGWFELRILLPVQDKK